MELYAEDLVRGYRPLILRVGDGQVALPCMRHEWHHLLDADPDHRRVDDDAHAWISTGPTESDRTPPELYLQEVVVRWEGWALSVPRPGKWIAPDGSGHEAPTDQRPRPDSHIGLESTMTVVPGTQPRLRFGARYALAVTMADLAGNEPGASRFGDSDVTAELTYLRYEPVSPPAVVLTEQIGAESAPGEAIDRLVIRTDNGDPDSDPTLTTEKAERHLAPPMTSQAMAETHGKFDELDDESSYSLIVSREGSFPTSPGDTDDPLVPTSELVDGSLPMPYLPDPIANGITLTQLPGMTDGEIGETANGGDLFYRIAGADERPPNTLIILDTSNEKLWADTRSARLRLVAGDDKPTWDPSERVLSVHVPAGWLTRLRYSSRASSDLDLLAVYLLGCDAVSGDALTEFNAQPSRGVIGCYTIPRAHSGACDTPAGGSPFCEDFRLPRPAGQTYGDIVGTIKLDLPSTGEVAVEAEARSGSTKVIRPSRGCDRCTWHAWSIAPPPTNREMIARSLSCFNRRRWGRNRSSGINWATPSFVGSAIARSRLRVMPNTSQGTPAISAR